MARCVARTKGGKPCTNRAAEGCLGLCRTHFNVLPPVKKREARYLARSNAQKDKLKRYAITATQWVLLNLLWDALKAALGVGASRDQLRELVVSNPSLALRRARALSRAARPIRTRKQSRLTTPFFARGLSAGSAPGR
jgi:hypothetical protein